MNDADILKQISDLANEEKRLEEAHVGLALSDEEHARLHDIEGTLDQCWDLLRQRRAHRMAGQNPDEASIRPLSVVEDYQ